MYDVAMNASYSRSLISMIDTSMNSESEDNFVWIVPLISPDAIAPLPNRDIRDRECADHGHAPRLRLHPFRIYRRKRGNFRIPVPIVMHPET